MSNQLIGIQITNTQEEMGLRKIWSIFYCDGEYFCAEQYNYSATV